MEGITVTIFDYTEDDFCKLIGGFKERQGVVGFHFSFKTESLSLLCEDIDLLPALISECLKEFPGLKRRLPLFLSSMRHIKQELDRA